ncbi:hypothetical protein LCGC14_1875080 [marine sediment metagenome]|uniref:4Fe-4S ferredoxin-type domain-containing protein n=1 Tax=marine sediment metagenome TaxID=412755 RepID=A0A0F9G3U9_9ZZZZ
MANESSVYWASPYEQPALPNTAENMATNNLVKTKFILDKILDNIYEGDKVGVKVHVGEAHNTRYLRPDYVREVVKTIKSKGGIPTLIETHGRGNDISDIEMNNEYHICVGHRKKTEDHLKIAQLHGYTESITGAPLEFIDGEDGIDRKIVKIDGIQLKKISVAKGLFKFDKLVVISHFKGHAFAGFGGALKQLGLGCVTKHNKHLAHMDKNLVVNSEKCNPSSCNQECIDSCPIGAIKIEEETAHINDSSCFGCSKCSQKCPIKGAIKGPGMNSVKNFVERFIDNTMGVLTFGPEKIRYINFAIEIPLMCDCASNPSMPVIPDLGIYGSSDPVAIDRACVDAETNAPGLPILNKEGEWTTPLKPGIEKFKAMIPYLDPLWVFEAAVRNNLGNISYKLIKI